jgi:hypothetical protein
MEADKLKSTSPRRYIKDKPQERETVHTVDFSTFRRKNNDLMATVSEETITCPRKNGPPITVILAGMHLITNRDKTKVDLFKEVEVTNSERHFAQYLNEKTLL